MEKFTCFPYSWHIDEDEEDVTVLRIYCLDKHNKNVCIRINNFTPFVYLELPEHIPWTNGKAQLLGNKLDSLLGDKKPLIKRLMYKKRLYYAYLNSNNKRKTFPYLFLSFSHHSDIRNMSYKIRKPLNIIGIGTIKVKMHEQDASPILQFTSYRNIPTAGWINFMGKRIPKEEKITLCDHEFKVKWKNVSPNNCSTVSSPLIMGFDIEVNSTIPSAMPKAERPGDKVFQISCVLFRHGDDEKNMEKFILTLGEPDPKTVGEDVEIIMFETEHDLLVGYTEFIQQYNPNVIVGYNILNFDIPYMIDRAKINYCIYDFDQQGFVKNSHAKEKTIKWSSSAYGNQTFQFLDAEGRLYVDLLPLVKRDYKMDNYKLKTISTYFLGSTKDPLSVKGIFKCYRIGIKHNNGVYSKKAQRAMGIVARYCVQDSALVIRLFNKLQTWIGLCEMARTCRVPIFYLYTQGQQIKVYSQLYHFCMYKNIVVEKDGYIPKDNEHYMGAHVFEPKPGVYDRVLPFDFCSLYPTTIIAYNIDYSTLVIDDSIPDRDCHVIEWTEHQGCSHDKSVRKTKPKYVLCGDRRYRFLKEPKGVMPTVLQNLLDARVNTRKQIKIIKKFINKEKLDETDEKLIEELNILDQKISPEQVKSLNTLIDVLNKRQLAYRVSANSVGAVTPIPCKLKGNFVYRTIEELSQGDWKYINDDQEISTPIEDLLIWSDKGFTKPKYIMRHPQEKPLKRIITHTGFVDCTEDHSLLTPDGIEVKPSEVNINDGLLHYKYPLPIDTPSKPAYLSITDESIRDFKLNTKEEELAFAHGLFYAEGSCDTWEVLGKAKSSWIIYNQDLKLLQRVQNILNKHEGEFIISNFYESASVYHLKPKGAIKSLSDRYRSIFYNKRKYKIVPDYVLVSPINIRQAFFQGYYAGDGNRKIKKGVIINNKGQIGTASLMYLANSLGYNVSISNGKNNDIYRLQCCEKFRNKHINKIKSIKNYSPYSKIQNTQSKIIRNNEHIKFDGGISFYRKIKIHCNRFPRQKLLDALDIAIKCANKRYSYITDYFTKNKKLSYKKYCCGKEYNISLRILKEQYPDRNDCKCDKNILNIIEYNSNDKYSLKDQIDYVYDIETENHHFAAGIGHMIVHNSMYGAMGVTRGYLPFMPGAMCTTAMGRKNNILAANTIVNKYKGQLIYGDTDSSYVTFPHLKTAQENWDYAEKVAEEVSKLFPKPMMLEFEQEIYWRFFILTKKRYMYKKCGRDGVVEEKIGKKGVLLARRDNSAFIRNIYSELVMKVFNKSSKNDILYYVIDEINKLCSNYYSFKDFIVTKSIGSGGDGQVIPFINEKGVKKGKMGDYTVPLLSTEKKERERQFKLKDCNNPKDYYLRCLPAVVQLAERMRQRGQRVDVGSRLEYVISSQGGPKAKQYEKVEDAGYFSQHSSVLKIDYMYYLKLLSNPFDDILNILYNNEDANDQYKFKKDFVLDQYKYRLKIRSKMHEELKQLSAPKLTFK
jgi:DNA polymerase elongation subunit (family B)